MAIPENQLDTWSHQGAMAGSRDTYATVRRALEAAGSGYADKSYEIFLQGSYGNDTNIYAESDVDVVIRLDSTYYYDISALSGADQQLFRSRVGVEPYGHPEFKAHVLQRLQSAFPGAATSGKKAIAIAAGGGRRKADVLPAVAHRHFRSINDYTEGLCFFGPDGLKVVNYPRYHSANCTTKHQATHSSFKPTVRIWKNMRGPMIDRGLIEAGCAPSYYLEGLLYNVPTGHFGGSYTDTLVNAINWIYEADRSKFVCANEQFYLLRDARECWSPAHGDRFLAGLINLWKDW
jgi:hypothetical protein